MKGDKDARIGRIQIVQKPPPLSSIPYSVESEHTRTELSTIPPLPSLLLAVPVITTSHRNMRAST